MKTLLLSLLTILFLTGCGDNSYNTCKEEGYKGIVFYTDMYSPRFYCSNGELVLNNKAYATKYGNKSIALNAIYVPFNIVKETE